VELVSGPVPSSLGKELFFDIVGLRFSLPGADGEVSDSLRNQPARRLQVPFEQHLDVSRLPLPFT